MHNDFMLVEVLIKIKETISIEKFDDTKISIDTDNKLVDNITSKKVVILMTCVIKNDGE